MPDPDNASFEDAGAAAGEADKWVPVITSGGYKIADFGEGGVPKPVEDFTGPSWGTDPYAWVVEGGTVGVFDTALAPTPSNAETFGRWSNNHHYQSMVEGGVEASFDSGTAAAEKFEDTSWGTDPYVTEVSAAAGNEGTTFSDGFESGWGAYITVVSGGTTATFAQGAYTAEKFENVRPDILFVVDDPATDVLVAVDGPHGQSNGYKVTVVSTGAHPAGLTENQVYYFVSTASTTFKLSKTLGGSPVDILDYGSGDHFVHADEKLYWTETE